MNGALLLHLPPCCPNMSSIEPTFADYKLAVRDLAYRHPEMPDRLSHVLAFASIPISSGHYREARREFWRHLPELTGPRKPLEGFLPRLPHNRCLEALQTLFLILNGREGLWLR